MSIKSQIGQRLFKFYETLGISKSEFARRLGKLPQNMNVYFTGDADVLSLVESLQAMGCDKDWLLTGKMDNIDAELKTHRYPVIGTAAAGLGSLTVYEENQYYEFATIDYDPNTHFFVKVDKNNGTSMFPVLKEGDMILCSQLKAAKPGEIVLAVSQKTQAGSIKVFAIVEGYPDIYALKSYNQSTDVIMVNKDKVKIYPAVAIKYC